MFLSLICLFFEGFVWFYFVGFFFFVEHLGGLSPIRILNSVSHRVQTLA